MPPTGRGLAAGGPSTLWFEHDGDYPYDALTGEHSPWAVAQSGLTVFALFVIARCCVRHASSWWRGPAAQPRGADAAPDGHDEREKWRRETTTTTASAGAGASPNLVLDGAPRRAKPSSVDGRWTRGPDALPGRFVSPPPELSAAVFSVERGPPHLEDSFIHQPNPDYTSSTASSVRTSERDPSTPRRRSYHKMMPVDPRAHSPSADSTLSSGSSTGCPPSPPPPPPHSSSAGEARQRRREIDVRGEILSFRGEDGAGWTRHTRVYGGGVCQACAASGADDGGFYGATVPMEEMR
ncbi:hypothetical protein RJ55_03730 [Drechmeria coniospora]|nr:hypothetical protein RJ55_03730 [Drechmeria coniospora]